MKKDQNQTTTGGFSDMVGWPVNASGQQTGEPKADPLIYGYQRGGTVPQTPGNVFRRRMAMMMRQGRGERIPPTDQMPPQQPLGQGVAGFQRGGEVGAEGNRPPWAGGPQNRTALPPGLARLQAAGQGPYRAGGPFAGGGAPALGGGVTSNDPAFGSIAPYPVGGIPPIGTGTGGPMGLPSGGSSPDVSIAGSPYLAGAGTGGIASPFSGVPNPTDNTRVRGYAKGGKIQPLNPANKGKFTASAKAAGKGVQGFASQVLSAPKGQYSATQRKRANFARNAAGWSHK